MTDKNQTITKPQTEEQNPNVTQDPSAKGLQNETPKKPDVEGEKDIESEGSPQGQKEEKNPEPEESEEREEKDFRQMSEQDFQEKTKQMVLPTLLKFFRPELINRFDDIILFHPLRRSDLKNIVEIMLKEPREMLREKNIEFRLSDAAKAFLAEVGYSPAFGARPLRRVIQQYLEDPLSDHLISQDFGKGDTIVIGINKTKDGLTFQKDIPDEVSVKEERELDPFAELENEKQEPKADSSSESLDSTPEEQVASETPLSPGEGNTQKPSFLNKVFNKN